MPIIAVIGPSGAGKSTLVDMYLAEHSDAILHKSVTTRPMRDASDTSHTFVTDAEFDALHREGKLIQPVSAYGYRYALPLLPNDAGKTIFVLIRAPFVAQFLAHYPNAHVVQVEAPIDVLATRLAARGDAARIDEAALQQEIDAGKEVATAVVSGAGSLSDSYAAFCSIVDSRSSQ